MRRGHSPIDDYDRESDYYRDLEDALPKQKNSLPAPTSKERLENNNTNSITHDSKNITVGD